MSAMSTAQSTAPELLTVREVAALLRVHRNTLYSIPGLQQCRVAGLPRRIVRYDAARVRALLARQYLGAA